ncbi:MAG: rod shape-determining protein MreC [Kofleriaceae bacterium]
MTLRRRLLDWTLAAILIIAPALVLRASLRTDGLGAVDEAMLRVTSPLQAAVTWLVEGIGGAWSRYVALVDVERENRELRAENERLRSELATTARRAFDVEALEDLAQLRRQTRADVLGARVISAPMSPQFRVLRLRIDRGEHDVQVGMPVISANGPVGRIQRVWGDYADVMLVSDPLSSIEVVIPRSGGRGILAGLGRGDSYACKIEWLERASRPEAKVVVGDVVVTSGLGATFPPGMEIGKVRRVLRDDGMFQHVEIEPTVNPGRVRVVEVLLAPPPPPDPDAGARRKSEPAFGGRAL